ncbi:MAG: type IV secretion system DNA-binding domain-containing protein [bacterium]|nr:type IV secretion system DNA-binding domain-containing protein [bacterium]
MNFFSFDFEFPSAMIDALPYVGGAILLIVLAQLARWFLHYGHRFSVSFKMVVLLVTLPKEAAKDKRDEKSMPATHQNLQEKIAVAETFFASIGGMRAERGFKAWLFGREDHFSFEIVADKGLISFYIAIPTHHQQYIEQQIQAQYPEAQIDLTSDYNIFVPQGKVVGTYLTFKRSFFFPLKTYKKIESDTLNALTNSLSKIGASEGAVIQFVVRSAKGAWHKWGVRVAKEMQQGKTLEHALRVVNSNFLLRTIGNLTDYFSTKKKDGMDGAKEKHSLSPLEQEMVKGLEEKTAKGGMDVNIRIVVASKDAERAEMLLENIVNAFNQFNVYEYGNSLEKTRPESHKHLRKLFFKLFLEKRLIRDFIFRSYRERRKLILNTEEMASLYHFPLPTTETPNIQWLLAKRAPAPVNTPTEGILLGKNTFRSVTKMIHLKKEDRRRHLYIIGKSGVGKSVFLDNMVKQDIANGEGVCVIDPHGDFAESVLASVPKERADDVVIFNPSDVDRPVGLNMLEARSPEQRDFAVQEMIAIFYKLFPPEMIGPMFEHHMRNVMLTLMADIENPGTIIDIPRMFSDQDFQKGWVAKLKDPVVRAYWEKEVAKTSDFHKSEMLGYLISKVGRFVENEMMRNIMGQQKSGFDFREVMDKKKILIVNLSKGKTGETNSSLLGLIIVSKLQMAAMSRAELPEEERHDFYLYIDEFQNFITDSIATILSEARKYRLDLIVAHQYMGQLVKDGKDTRIRDAVLGNAGTMVSFRIGVEDAQVLAKEFAPVFNEYDMINVEKYTAYVKLLIDNQAGKAFNMQTMPPTKGNPELAAMIKELSRLKYGRDKRIVEAEILERSQLGEAIEEADVEFAEPSR